MDGDDTAPLAAPRYDAENQVLHLADALVAAPITPEMWSYQQGAYLVLRDYLEQRQGRALNGEEFDDFRNLAAVVSLTLERLPKIDAFVRQATADAVAVDDLGLQPDAD